MLASSGWGGTEKAFVALANALVGRWRVTVAVPADAVYLPRLAPAVAVRHLRSGSRRNPLALLHLRRLVREADADVVHSHAARAAEMVHWVGRTTAVTHVATKHNTRDRWIFPRVRWVTAVSEQVRATVRDGRGVELVYNGVDVPPRALEPKPQVFTILAVGRLHRHKGFDRLIRAVAGLPFDYRLEIAGEGPERTRLEALAAECGVQERVRLLGHREDVADRMARAHVLVVPSRTEGFNLALVEGLALCDVVLSTPVGIAPELLPDELLAPPDAIADRLTEVHERHAEFADRTARVREAVGDRFSLATAVAGYERIYRRAIEAAGRGV